MSRGIYSVIYGEVNVSVSVCVEIKGDYIEKYHSCFISITLKSWSGRKILDPPSYIVVVRSVVWLHICFKVFKNLYLIFDLQYQYFY
jgi:hypothetical protein